MRRGTNNSVNFAGKCMSIIIVWCMVLSGFMGLFMVNVGTASQINPNTISVDLIVDSGDFVIESFPGDPWIYDLDGNLTISGANSLILKNSTLNILQLGAYSLDVSVGGTIEMINSTITTEDLQYIDASFITNSNLIMDDNSALLFPGNLSFDASSVDIKNSQIISPAIYFDTCTDVSIADSEIEVPANANGSFNLDNTEMSIINTDINLDYTTDNSTNHQMNLTAGSFVYAYNMTVGDLTESIFIFDDAVSEVYYYKWADFSVVDSNNNPIDGAEVSYDFHHTDAAAITYVDSMNDLALAPHANADARMIDYLNSMSPDIITSANYDETNSDGMAMIPLFTTLHSQAEQAIDVDGHHYGEYDADITYMAATGSTYVDFSPYPNIEWMDNTVETPPVQLTAITLVRPDLTLATSDITFTPATGIMIGDSVEINVTIENVEITNALDVFVQVFDYDDVSGIPTEIYNTTIPSIPGNGDVYFLVDWNNIQVGGWHDIMVVIDYNNSIIEEEELNNTAIASIYITPDLPELSIETANIGFSQENISFDNEITISARVLNNGTLNWTIVIVSFYEDNPDMNGDGILDIDAGDNFIASSVIGIIEPNILVETSVPWTPSVDGTYTVYVWVDPSNNIPEFYEDNNLASRDVIITPKPNPTITNLGFDDETPMTGQTVVISLDLINTGNIDATGNITVEFFDYDLNGVLIGQIGTAHMKRDLNMSETFLIQQNWIPVNINYHTIEVIITSDADVDEGDLTDNEFYIDILVYDGGVFDLIVNDALPPLSAGDLEIIGHYGQDGYVLVEENGILTIDASTFDMKLERSYQYNIIVKDNGTLNIMDTIFWTQNNFMDLHIMDNAVVNVAGTSLPDQLNIIAGDSSQITFHNSQVRGVFSVPDSDANVSLVVENCTFSKPITQFGGTSVAHLTALTMAIPSIQAQDTADIKIYRWLEVEVIDVNDYPIPGAMVDLDYQVGNALQPGLHQTKTTGADGKVLFRTLSDIINHTIHQSSASVSSYKLTSSFLTFQNHINITLPSYPDMTSGSNYIDNLVIKMSDVRPDLDPPLWASATTIGKDEAVMIWTNVSNMGDVDAHDVVVRFADETNSYVLEDVPIALLEAGTYQWVYINYTWPLISDIGEHLVNVTVDWNNNIIEQNETNNYNSTLIHVIGRPDLSITDDSIVIYNNNDDMVINYPVNIGVTVDNTGDIDISNVSVRIYDSETNGTLIGETNIATVPFDQSSAVFIEWIPSVVGDYDLFVVIDENNTIFEIHEDNNTAGMNVTVVDYSDLYVSQIVFKEQNGNEVDEVDNRTYVDVCAQIINAGETRNIGTVQFNDHYGNEFASFELPYMNPGDIIWANETWFASEDLEGDSIIRNVEVWVTTYYTMIENPVGDNSLVEPITIIDTRADLTATADDVNVTTENIIEANNFGVNVTVYNDGIDTAINFTVEIFYDEMVDGNLIGSMLVDSLVGNDMTSMDITCSGIPTEGEHYLLISIDRDVIIGDNFTVNGMDYNITGNVEEFDEMNNDLINVTVDVEAPDYQILLNSPSVLQNYTLGVENNTFVTGRLTKVIGGQGVAGITITIQLDSNTVTTVTDASGNFAAPIDLPTSVGQYTIVASAENSVDTSVLINLNEEGGIDPVLIMIIVIIIIAAVIIGITLYFKFVGLGKTVECGECGAFIPESAAKCPKCNTEFESDTAKCSVCGAWVPMNSKACPECNSEFTIGDEEIDDYKAQMQKQYDEVVNGFRTEAKKELGSTFSEDDFQAWWATQATFITFDQWLKEDEEMKRLGSKPCPNCTTPNSITATICHKCGTVMAEEKKVAPVAAAPVAVKKAATQEKVAPTPVAAAPVEDAPAPEPAAEENPAGDEKKKCPSCGMELGAHEKACPICAYEFDKGEEKPPEGGSPPAGGAAPTKKVVRKPVKKVVRRPVQKTGGEGQQ